jgi:hypothetical protein
VISIAAAIVKRTDLFIIYFIGLFSDAN